MGINCVMVFYDENLKVMMPNENETHAIVIITMTCGDPPFKSNSHRLLCLFSLQSPNFIIFEPTLQILCLQISMDFSSYKKEKNNLPMNSLHLHS